LKRVLKISLIIIVFLVLFVYGSVFLGHKVIFKEEMSNVPTIQAATNDTFIFGPQAHSAQPGTIDDYILLLAKQIKRYNEVAPTLWPDNAVVNQSAIVEGLRSGKFWLIAPDGTVTPLSKDDVKSYGMIRNAYVGGFSFFDGGMYLAVNEEHLTNYLQWQKYLHLGTYDAFLSLAHEGFHRLEQGSSKWQIKSDAPNRERNEFSKDTPARAKRALLQKQLLRAVSEPGDTRLILDALATYADYKAKFPGDYKNSLYFDRIEGTAYYYELISGLYSGYPDQVRSKDDLGRALTLLATREDIYVWHGLVAEGYIIGGFSSVLLDRLEVDWKERLMSDPEATPLEILYQHFKNESLPLPQRLTQAVIDAADDKIQNSNKNRIISKLFRLLYDILF
jgi:hypothetical protein